MSENNEASSFATAGSGKSEAEVAFDLLNKLKGQGVWGERNKDAILDMYAAVSYTHLTLPTILLV